MHFFMQQAADKYEKNIESVDPAVQQLMMAYNWPGNVRQLRTVTENMVVLAEGDRLTPELLPPEIRPPATGDPTGGMEGLVGISIEQAELELIRNTLKMTEGNREKAARILGIGERTLYRKIKEYGL